MPLFTAGGAAGPGVVQGRHQAFARKVYRNDMLDCLANSLIHIILPQVVLLDPVSYPGAIKAFAKEVCRNDLLNFGRLHFFFPDSRLSLDLNTDKTLKVSIVTSLSAICWRCNVVALL